MVLSFDLDRLRDRLDERFSLFFDSDPVLFSVANDGPGSLSSLLTIAILFGPVLPSLALSSSDLLLAVTSSVESGRISSLSDLTIFIEGSIDADIRLLSLFAISGLALSAGEPSVKRLLPDDTE